MRLEGDLGQAVAVDVVDERRVLLGEVVGGDGLAQLQLGPEALEVKVLAVGEVARVVRLEGGHLVVGDGLASGLLHDNDDVSMRPRSPTGVGAGVRGHCFAFVDLPNEK